MNTRPCCPPTSSNAACPPGPLSRPHFFAGQCLTEDDLNAMQHYLVERQQRHNRFLHGVGVVNGLKVCSHPCPGWITIKAGFAIGPCGEEICVPEDYEFDLCSAIKNKCPSAARCVDQFEFHWQIRIRYAETECSGTAPVAPTRGKCGCGCQDGRKGAKSAPCRCHSANPSPVVACLPSRIRECFEIDVVPVQRGESSDVWSDTLVGNLMKCLRNFGAINEIIKEYSGHFGTLSGIAVIKPMEAALAAREIAVGLLSGIACAASVPAPYNVSSVDKFREYFNFVEKSLRTSSMTCLCENILPVMPSASEADGISIATITTLPSSSSAPCAIQKICNLDHRQQMITLPLLQYWVSIVPSFWAALEKKCCIPENAYAFMSAKMNRLMARRDADGSGPDFDPDSMAGSSPSAINSTSSPPATPAAPATGPTAPAGDSAASAKEKPVIENPLLNPPVVSEAEKAANSAPSNPSNPQDVLDWLMGELGKLLNSR